MRAANITASIRPRRPEKGQKDGTVRVKYRVDNFYVNVLLLQVLKIYYCIIKIIIIIIMQNQITA